MVISARAMVLLIFSDMVNNPKVGEKIVCGNQWFYPLAFAANMLVFDCERPSLVILA
jgi:hypothetical protein